MDKRNVKLTHTLSLSLFRSLGSDNPTTHRLLLSGGRIIYLCTVHCLTVLDFALL